MKKRLAGKQGEDTTKKAASIEGRLKKLFFPPPALSGSGKTVG